MDPEILFYHLHWGWRRSVYSECFLVTVCVVLDKNNGSSDVYFISFFSESLGFFLIYNKNLLIFYHFVLA